MAWIEKRGNKYKVYWDVGSTENRERRVASFDSSEEANQFKKKVEYELSVGTYIEVSKMTFGEYLEHWIRLHGPKLAPKTLDSYKGEIRTHIKPNLGQIKLSKLSPMHLQDYYAHLLEQGKAEVLQRQLGDLKDMKNKKSEKLKKNLEARLKEMLTAGKAGLSPTSVNYQHRIIRKALNQAVKWQMVARNVADAVEPPKRSHTQIQYLGRDEVNRFIGCIKESQYYPIIATAILTGMRRGEILGLRWQDVDLAAGVIHVRQQLQYIPGQGYFFKEPKQHSIRDIPMPLPMNSILRSVRKNQSHLKEIYSEKYHDNNLIFCLPDGQPASASTITRSFQALLDENGFERIRFHSLRHSFATMARAAGVPMEDIQDLLGHADISTTKNMYTHVEIEPLRDSMKKLTDYLDI